MSWRRAGIGLGFAAVLAIAAMPVLLVLVPPVADYANHLARLHILADHARSEDLRRLYEVRWQLTPYVGMDALGAGLALVLPIYWVGRVLVVLVWALFLLGALLLHRAVHGGWSAWPLAAGLFLYSFPFHMGFLPYLLSAALAVIGFAVWVAGERWSPWQRVAAGAAAALAVFLCHYAGIVALGLCFAGHDAVRWWQAGRPRRGLAGRLAIVALPFALPAVLSLMAMGGAQPGPTRYDPWRQQLSGLLSATLFPGSRVDLAIPLLALLGVGAGIATRRIALPARLWLPAGAMMLATLVLPGAPMGLWGMQYRLPVVAAVVLVGGVRVLRPGWPEAVAALVAGALFVGHVGTIGVAWRPLDAQYRELQAALAQMPRGSRLLTFVADRPGDPTIHRGPYFTWMHMAALAVVERDAFYPNLHKQPMMTVHASALTAPISPHESPPIPEALLWDGLVAAGRPRAAANGRPGYWIDWPRRFDMAIGLHFGAAMVLPPLLVPVHRGSFFTLYRVARPE